MVCAFAHPTSIFFIAITVVAALPVQMTGNDNIMTILSQSDYTSIYFSIQITVKFHISHPLGRSPVELPIARNTVLVLPSYVSCWQPQSQWIDPLTTQLHCVYRRHIWYANLSHHSK